MLKFVLRINNYLLFRNNVKEEFKRINLNNVLCISMKGCIDILVVYLSFISIYYLFIRERGRG